MKYLLKNIQLTLLLLLLLLIAIEAKSQWTIGIEGGYVNNHLLTNISNRTLTTNTNGHSFGVGIFTKYTFKKKWIAIETGLSFLQKKYAFVRTGEYQGIYQNYTNNYVQLPVGAMFRLFHIKGFKTYIDAGVYFGYWASGNQDGVTPNILNVVYSQQQGNQFTLENANAEYAEKYTFDKKRDQRFEFGGYTGLTLAYDFLKKYGVFLRGRFYQSATEQQKKYSTNQIAQYNQSLFVSAGFLYTFLKKKKMKNKYGSTKK